MLAQLRPALSPDTLAESRTAKTGFKFLEPITENASRYLNGAPIGK
jgi:hypothetical protein